MADYAERCLRGLRDSEWLIREEASSTIWLSHKAFHPNEKTRAVRLSSNKSDHSETSINWEDDPEESFRILAQDTVNSRHGILVVSREDLETAKRVNPIASKTLSWERDPQRKNRFHGNLLFVGTVPKPMLREVASVLATHVQGGVMRVVEPENYPSEIDSRKQQKENIPPRVQRQSWLHTVGGWLKDLIRESPKT